MARVVILTLLPTITVTILLLLLIFIVAVVCIVVHIAHHATFSVGSRASAPPDTYHQYSDVVNLGPTTDTLCGTGRGGG